MNKIVYGESQIIAAIKMYSKDGLSLQATADKFGFTRSWLRNRFVERNVEFRRRWAAQWRRCRGCERTFRVSKENFYHRKDYLCKKCAVQKSRKQNYEKNFGLSFDDYKRMLGAQDGVCLICGSNGNGRNLSVDHDHVTGNIRGLLCSHCNTGIGMFRDSYELLEKAIEYLHLAKSHG